METSDREKFERHQKRIYYWSIGGFLLFIIAWTAGIYREFFGFNPHWAGDNFVFNITFLFPATIISLLISSFTAINTILNWKQFPDKRKSIIILILASFLIGYVFYSFLIVLRQH